MEHFSLYIFGLFHDERSEFVYCVATGLAKIILKTVFLYWFY